MDNPKLVNSHIIDCIPQAGECPMKCDECVTGDTKILTDMMRWIDIKNVRVGDTVIGFSTGFGRTRSTKRTEKFLPTRVEAISTRMADVYEIVTDKGNLKCTDNHPLFNGREWFCIGKNYRGIGTERAKIKFLSTPVYTNENDAFRAGYVWGLLHGDGTIGNYKQKNGKYDCRTMCLRMTDKEAIEVYRNYLQGFDISTTLHYIASYTGGIINGRQIHGIKPLWKVDIRDKIRWDAIHKLFDYDKSYPYDFACGWLGGIYDSEGSLSSNILRIAQKTKKEIRILIKKYLSRLSFNFRSEKDGFRLLGGKEEQIRFLCLTKPKILRKQHFSVTKLYGAKIKSINFLGHKQVYNLQTSCQTYYANGFAVHNCFYNSGFYRDINIPLIPSKQESLGKIVRINSGHDSNLNKDIVLKVAANYSFHFFNTAIPRFSGFDAPIVFTCNRNSSDPFFIKRTQIGDAHIMFVRIRTNVWDIEIQDKLIKHYLQEKFPVVITFMRYKTVINPLLQDSSVYEFKNHILNSYYVLRPEIQTEFMAQYNKTGVRMCGTPYSSYCVDCRNCEFFFWQCWDKGL